MTVFMPAPSFVRRKHVCMSLFAFYVELNNEKRWDRYYCYICLCRLVDTIFILSCGCILDGKIDVVSEAVAISDGFLATHVIFFFLYRVLENFCSGGSFLR